jgi:predicted nucleic acid-binding protein
VVLSNFALAGALDLLISRYGSRAMITAEVLVEVSEGVVAGYAALQPIEDAVLDGRISQASAISAAERKVFNELLRTLAAGESSCVACAQARDGVVVTDDKTARQCCAERTVRFTGTIGILKACTGEGSISHAQADTILQSMIAAGYHSPVRRISDLL